MGDYEIGRGRPPREFQFKPGQSGNPNGWPKGVPRISTALAKLLRCGQGEKFPLFSKADQVAKALFDKAMGGDVSAIGMIFDRIEGKLSQTLNLTAGSQSDQELARQMFEDLIEGGKTPEQARTLLLEVGVEAIDIE
jgi:Family of unknown function (DUF5681)